MNPKTALGLLQLSYCDLELGSDPLLCQVAGLYFFLSYLS